MALTGSLDELAAVEIMQILALGQKNGILTITCEDEEGHAYFADGRVIHAMCGELRGEDAIFKMLGLEEGFFSFEVGEVDCDVTITAGIESLILEAVRRSDESGATERAQRKLKEHYRFRIPAHLESAGLLRSYFADYFSWSKGEERKEPQERASASGTPPDSMFFME